MNGPLQTAREASPMRRWRSWRANAKCLLALWTMRIALHFVGYSAIRRRIPAAPATQDGHFYARQLARRIERLARHVPGASCLTQALALQWLLARAGHASALNIGVRCDEAGRFRAHAWVLCNGRVVIGESGTRLSEFTRIAVRP